LELCTEKRIPNATKQGYAPQSVDKFWIRGVDNWVGGEKSGEEKKEKGVGGPFPGYLHHDS
jgi:hypothetical protein